jgi:peptidoglycan/LPS O-acetylase OafA/YrhL
MNDAGLGRSRHRIDQADGLRALACMLVIWQHVSEVYRSVSSGGLWLSTIADTVDFGRIGVCAFFGISGFVVPSSMRGPRLEGVLDFAERRFWRLFPPYWFSIPIGILAVWVAWGRLPTLPMALANTSMLASLWGEDYAMGHYWTLEVELVFYSLCALLYLIGGRIRLVSSFVCLVLALVVRHYELLGDAHGHWPYLPNDLAIMFWGCCCRLLYDQPLLARWGRWDRALRVALVVAMMSLILREPLEWLRIGFSDDSVAHRRLGWGYALGPLLFALWVLLGRVRSRFLESIGKGSYSIYLLHPVVFYVVLKCLNLPEFRLLRGHHLGFYLALLGPLCVAVGMFGFRLIELPSDQLRRLITRPDRARNDAP